MSELLIGTKIPAKLKFAVHTLDQNGLQKLSHELVAVVQQDFQPNIVIGIRTGGFYVAELMCEVLPKGVALLPLTCRRPSTGKKKRFSVVKDMLMTLPHAVTDRLRVLEHWMLTQRRPPQSLTIFTPDAEELAALVRLLAVFGAQARVLAVDDAVDSGATLQAVLATVQNVMHRDAVLKSAALTVTTAKPLVHPDYQMYSHVLCRFPWSLDFKSATRGDLRPRRDAAVG